MSAPEGLVCGTCRAQLHEGDRFCEQCGASIPDAAPAPRACVICGTTEPAGEDGYCPVCGARERSLDDRTELDLGVAAAITDRGRVHSRNEDAFALSVSRDGGFAAVICDGISSASAGDAAARSAVDAALEVLSSAATDPTSDLVAATRDAAAAAVAAVTAVEWTTRVGRETPSCTLVSAVGRDDEIVIGSAGDSRAYWLDVSGTRRLTVDDSWATSQIAAGTMSADEAMADSRAHTITNWIGPDAPDRGPRVSEFMAPGSGRLLLCSDGLWNYLASDGELGDLIGSLPQSASPAAVARDLADAALRRGGRDNITIVIVELDGGAQQ